MPAGPQLAPYARKTSGAEESGILERTLKSFSSYYHCWRTHLSLGIDAQKADRYRLPTKVRSSKFRKSVVCIITTNAELPDLHHNLSGGYLTAVDAAATCRRLRFSSRQVNKFARRICHDTRAYSLFGRTIALRLSQPKDLRVSGFVVDVPAQFGRVSSIRQSGRSVQLGLKVHF